MSEGLYPIARAANNSNDTLSSLADAFGSGIVPNIKSKAGRVYFITAATFFPPLPCFLMILDKATTSVNGDLPIWSAMVNNFLFSVDFNFSRVGGIYCSKGINIQISSTPDVFTVLGGDEGYFRVDYK